MTTLLDRLNPEQRDAVLTTEGPLLVLAGAGSGKTGVLTRRIAFLLERGVPAENLLAVTFTNKAAQEMKHRVVELAGEGAQEVLISTFHSTCARILRAEIEVFGQWTKRFAIYDDDDQLRIIKEIVQAFGYDPERVAASDLLSMIDHHKNRTAATADELIAQRRSHLNDPLVRVWREYDERLRAADAVDFNDLIHLVLRLWREHPDVRERWQERFHYVLVDEYQDTNAAQYQLVKVLVARRRNLMVVGDDDQSIYGFRGADIGNILNFQSDFPEAKVIRLERNYRSTANILAVSNTVVAKNRTRMEKRLWTEDGAGHAVTLIACDTPRDEANRVARGISALRRLGYAHADVAIIYRTNATSRIFESALREARVPHRIVGNRRFFELREIRDLLCYVRLLVNPVDDAAFLRIVNVPSRGIGPKTLSALREEAAGRGEGLLKTAATRPPARDAGGKAIAGFVSLMNELGHVARESSIAELLATTLERSGYRAMLEGSNTPEDRDRRDNVTALLHEAARFEPPLEAEGPLDQLRAWLDRTALAGQDEEIPEGGEVTLMTVHNAKGLEFPVVYVVQCVEGQFPHSRSMDRTDDVEEERRLAYVAFTRAKKWLIITRSRTTFTHGPPGTAPVPKSVAPSRFLYGLPADSIEGEVPDDTPTELVAEVTRLPDTQRAQLRALAERVQARAVAAADPDELRLVDITDPEDLVAGRRVHHPRHGRGTISAVRVTSLLVDFAGRAVPIRLHDPGLKLLRD